MNRWRVVSSVLNMASKSVIFAHPGLENNCQSYRDALTELMVEREAIPNIRWVSR
jgi:hypothetical protein